MFASSSAGNFPIGIRWPHELRRPLERAAADAGQSVADFVEGAVLRALAHAGTIEIESTDAKEAALYRR